MYFREVPGKDFSPSSGPSLIWSIIIKYNDALDEIQLIARKKAKETDQCECHHKT